MTSCSRVPGQNRRSFLLRVVLLGGALSVGLAALSLFGGCPPAEDQSAQDTLPDGQPALVLSAQEVAGPGGILIYQGEEITGDVAVPENALLGAVKDGQVYLYHPALGNEELSEYNSRRAVGYFLMGLTLPSKAPALRMKDPLVVGGLTKMKTGVLVQRDTATKCRVENASARWVALKTRFSATHTRHNFLPAAESNVPTTIIDIIDQATVGMFSTSSVRTIEVPEMAIESYGAVIRAYPLLLLPGAEQRYRHTFRGMADAMVHDLNLYTRVNSLDLTYSVFEGLKNLGRIVSPFECIDLVIPETLIGSAETLTMNLLNADDETMRKITLEYAKNLINSLVSCVVEVALGGPTNPAGLTVMAINEFSDIVGGAKWVVDTALFGPSDAVTYSPFDRLELARPVLPRSISMDGTLQDAGDRFTLTTEPALLSQGANLRIEYTWVPRQDGVCDPDYVPWAESIYMETLAGGGYTMEMPTITTPDTPGAEPRTWILETTTFGSGSTGTIEVRVIWDLLPVNMPFDPPSDWRLPCPGHFQVNATIEYAPAEE